MDALENFLLQSAAELFDYEDGEIDINFEIDSDSNPNLYDWLRDLRDLTMEEQQWIKKRTFHLLNEIEPELADQYAIWLFRNEIMVHSHYPDSHLVEYFLQASKNKIRSILQEKIDFRNLQKKMRRG